MNLKFEDDDSLPADAFDNAAPGNVFEKIRKWKACINFLLKNAKSVAVYLHISCKCDILWKLRYVLMGLFCIYGSNPRSLRVKKSSGQSGICGIKTWLFRSFLSDPVVYCKKNMVCGTLYEPKKGSCTGEKQNSRGKFYGQNQNETYRLP